MISSSTPALTLSIIGALQATDVVHVSWTDITPLRRLMQMNQAVLEAARSPMIVADEDGIILQANYMTSEVFEYTHVRTEMLIRRCQLFSLMI